MGFLAMSLIISGCVQDLVQSLGNKYKGRSYHLLQRNCNHFSEELVWRLCRQRLPSWVRDMPSGLLLCQACKRVDFCIAQNLHRTVSGFLGSHPCGCSCRRCTM